MKTPKTLKGRLISIKCVEKERKNTHAYTEQTLNANGHGESDKKRNIGTKFGVFFFVIEMNEMPRTQNQRSVVPH